MNELIKRINDSILRKYDRYIMKDLKMLTEQLLTDESRHSYNGMTVHFATQKDSWNNSFVTFKEFVERYKSSLPRCTAFERGVFDDIYNKVFMEPNYQVKVDFSQHQAVLSDRNFYFRTLLPVKPSIYEDLIQYILKFTKENICSYITENRLPQYMNDMIMNIWKEYERDAKDYFMKNTLGKYFANGGKFKHSFNFLSNARERYSWRKFRSSDEVSNLMECEVVWKAFLGSIDAENYTDEVQIFETGYNWYNLPSDMSNKIEFKTKPLCKQTYKWKKEHNFVIGLSPEFIPQLFIKYEDGKIANGFIPGMINIRTNKSVNQKMIDEKCMFYIAFSKKDEKNNIWFRSSSTDRFFQNKKEELEFSEETVKRENAFRRIQKMERIKNSKNLTNALKNGKNVKDAVTSYLNALSTYYTFDWKNPDSRSAMKFIAAIGDELEKLSEAMRAGNEVIKKSLEITDFSPWEISYQKTRIEDSVKRLNNSLTNANSVLKFSK